MDSGHLNFPDHRSGDGTGNRRFWVMGDDWGSDGKAAAMITTNGGGLALPRIPNWFATRLAVYLLAALFSGQAFVGLSGLGKGGEWIIVALACEIFCALWVARHRERLSSGLFTPMALDQPRRGLKIISAGPDIMNVSLVGVSEAESSLLRRLLNGISETGTSFVVRDASKEVLGVLMLREEYELLTAAAMIVRDPERWEELMHEPVDLGTSVEDAFRDK
jgi:hypothetical protein